MGKNFLKSLFVCCKSSRFVMSREILFTLLLVASSYVPEIDGGKSYLFHIPWACAVLEHPALKLISACAIFNDHHVLVAVDTIFGRTSSGVRYSSMLDKIRVQAGTNYMNGSSGPVQMRSVTEFLVGKTKHYDTYRRKFVWDEYLKTPITDDQIKQIQVDVFGASYSVGILKIQPAYVWDNYVHPITMNFFRGGKEAAEQAFTSFSTSLAAEPHPKTKCITYSWNEKENKIRYHEVLFLPRESCIDVFCDWDIINCKEIPNKMYHHCFKSTKFVDVCPNARGAALYCPSFASDSVFAILTTAPSCGLRKMPGVYSSLQLVIDLYEKVYSVDLSKEDRPELGDPLALDQRADDYEGIFV